MTVPRQFHYNIGDRVAERPKLNGLFATTKQSRELVKQYRTQRYGTVVGYTAKKNSLGRYTKFLVIQWDHLQSPMVHARNRICPIHELDNLVKAVVVPGE